MTTSETPPTADELVAAGWRRRLVADEPRLSEAVAAYEELGFEVKLLVVSLEDEACTECMRQEPNRVRAVYTRKRAEDE